jgi:hypothetical protein
MCLSFHVTKNIIERIARREPTKIYVDNSSTIILAKNPVFMTKVSLLMQDFII